MDYAIDFPGVVTLPVAESSKAFPVGRIYCVGRNYAEHAREMGHDPDREPPFFFGKPADTLLTGSADLPYPPQTQDLHFEAELVVALGAGGSDLAPDRAGDLIWGYAAGNDWTRRDLQAEAKRTGRPWDLAKGFDLSAACGPLHPRVETGPLDRGRIALTVDGDLRQDSDLSRMIWPVPEVIAHLSRFVHLSAGDLIFTGTPAGVGAAARGQTVTVTIDGLTPLVTRIV